MAHERTVCETLPLAQMAGKKRLQTKTGELIRCPIPETDTAVPRKPKTAADQAAPSDAGENPPQPSAMPPPAVRKVATRTKASGAKKKPARSSAPKRTKAQAAPDSAPSTSAQEPTDDDIRLRAYFIAERRMQLSVPGSEAEDWVEAKRQLEEESRGASG
jgi:hypothetical protein